MTRPLPSLQGQNALVAWDTGAGGSSGMRRQTAANVVTAGGSAVIIGQDRDRADETVQTLVKEG